MGSQSFAEMRRRNALRIVEIVRENPHLSRADVARMTTLARATVSSIVDELISAGLLRETGSKESSTKGRRPIGLSFNTEGHFVGGISVDHDRIDVVICDLDGVVRAEHSVAISPASLLLEELVKLAGDALQAQLSAAHLPLSKLRAIGLGVPGPLFGNIPNEIPPEEQVVHIDYRVVRDQLINRFEKEVILDTNLNMYSIAQARQGLEKVDSVLIVRVGHLVRSAFVLEGRILEGQAKRAGEIGHLKIPGQARPCFCGGMGCINTVASIPSIVDCCIDRNQNVRNMKDVSDAATNGNKECIEALRNAGIAIGYGVAAAINLLAPTMVLITGRNVMDHDCVQGEIYAAVQRHALSPNLKNCKLVLTETQEKAEAYGAALQAITSHELLPSLNQPNPSMTG